MIRIRRLWRRNWPLRGRLHGYRLLFRVTNGIGRLRFLQGQRLRQHHLDGCSYVEEKIVGAREQHERCYEADSAADTRSDDRVFCFGAEDRRGCRGAKGWSSDSPGGKVGSDFRLRLPDRVAD
jgi:hypothetical protein